VLLRREQYRRADDQERSLEIARGIVLAKAANCRTVLLRAVRDHPDTVDRGLLEDAARNLARIAESVRMAHSLDVLRGSEGEAARTYFGVFDHLIVAQKEDFLFRERSRRPPLDNINALLSFLYTLLAHDVTSSLEAVGLDPAVGYLHRDRPGRPGLALDLMEEFRPFLADRLALSLVNRQQVKGKGFKTTETGAVLMDDETRKQVLVAYQKRKQEEIQHSFIDEKITIGLLPHIQAMLFARCIRGDIDGYPPFLWR
jgi:CRISPR-associated protein Cas1